MELGEENILGQKSVELRKKKTQRSKKLQSVQMNPRTVWWERGGIKYERSAWGKQIPRSDLSENIAKKTGQETFIPHDKNRFCLTI